jgi:hypothetical protein
MVSEDLRLLLGSAIVQRLTVDRFRLDVVVDLKL